MISTLEDIFGGNNAALAAQVRRQDDAFAREFIERITRPLPTEHVADFGQRAVFFDEPKMRGMFSVKTRHYLEEPLNLFRRDLSNDITDIVFCGATRSGKTRIPMVALVYRIANDPTRCLWTKPMKQGAGGSRSDAKTKIIPMLKSSPGLAAVIGRCDKNALNNNQMMINGSIVDMEGTGSPKQLSGNPDDMTIQDECDGYTVTGNEAHPSILIDERTKDASNPLRYKCCSPTVEDGVIWTWLMRSDLRRRFMPCPRCSPLAGNRHRGTEAQRQRDAASDNFPNGGRAQAPLRLGDSVAKLSGGKMSFAELVANKFFVLGWSEQYNVLPMKMPDGTPIPVAYTFWDKEAKARDGEWDFQRVMQTAHFKCPHCGGKILNHEKEWMDERGQWHPTKVGAPGVAGFQLSSLYVTHDETSIGMLAKKFLMARENGQTMKGFINNDLAEVDIRQEHSGDKIELSSRPLAQPDWIPLLTADYHKNHPYLWFTVCQWCAFKMAAPLAITDGKPDFVSELDQPGNEVIREVCGQLIGYQGDPSLVTRHSSPVWNVIGELARFNAVDPDTGWSPLIDFLLAQKITCDKLLKFFKETANGDTLEFRRQILLAMWKMAGGDEKQFRAARGGDHELIAAGYCDRSGEYAWDELTEIIAEFKIGRGLKIPARGVFVDCGFAENKNRIVLQKCHESATEFDYYDPTVKSKDPFFTDLPGHYKQTHGWNGWQAIRGKPTFQSQGSGLGRDLGKHVEDPYFGTSKGGTSVVDILEIPTALFWLRKDDIRQKKTRQIFTISPNVSFFPKRFLPDGTRTEESNYKKEDFDRQSNMMILDETRGVIRSKAGTGGSQSKRHPDHPDDCMTYQVAAATHLEFFEDNSRK